MGNRRLRTVLPVAARISSLRISKLCFAVAQDRSLAVVEDPVGDEGRAFEVYSGFFDCEGMFLCISKGFGFLYPLVATGALYSPGARHPLRALALRLDIDKGLACVDSPFVLVTVDVCVWWL